MRLHEWRDTLGDGGVELVAFLGAGVEGVGGEDEDDSDEEAFHVGH